jgi:hypothetical protein
MKESPSALLAGLGWISLIVLFWLIILRKVPVDGWSIGGLVFFFVIALMASAVASTKKKG